MAKRVFLVVLDSFGLGNAPDANKFGDEGSNTLAAVCDASNEAFPNLSKMGLFSINGHKDPRILNFINKFPCDNAPIGSYARLRELSNGKDTTIGHWEIAGVLSEKPMPTFPNGFPDKIIKKLSEVTNRGILCNRPYSGTDVIRDYGEEHMKTGSLIVYTSADSVLQIAAHEDVVPVDELYSICQKAREIMTGPYAVGRIIARPFLGTPGSFYRTERRHDFSLTPPSSTMLDIISSNNKDVIAVGKITDIFASCGITQTIRTTGNTEGISVWTNLLDNDFNGLCFVNLVDFDMKYGHRNDAAGYSKAMHEFDDALGVFLSKIKKDDLLIITADHGCDPSTPSTDHSRETVPMLIYGDGFTTSHNLGELEGFTNIASIVLQSLFENKNDNLRVFTRTDLTNLKTTATIEDISTLIDNAISLNAASVCIQPCYVRDAYAISAGRIPICTVIGFPNGYQTTAVKVFEALDAIDAGATEIDSVINVCFVKSGRYDEISAEISALSKAVHSKGAILKVIIETCNLTYEEKIKLCKIVTDEGADFIKTSTGFASSGATISDVELLRKNVGKDVKVKAAGGIRTISDANLMIDAGADRIGASSLK